MSKGKGGAPTQNAAMSSMMQSQMAQDGAGHGGGEEENLNIAWILGKLSQQGVIFFTPEGIGMDQMFNLGGAFSGIMSLEGMTIGVIDIFKGIELNSDMGGDSGGGGAETETGTDEGPFSRTFAELGVSNAVEHMDGISSVGQNIGPSPTPGIGMGGGQSMGI